MDTQFFNKFNHYFKDDKVITDVIQYKKRSKIPANIKNPSQFKNKYKDFIIKNNELVYEPTGHIVIPKNDTTKVLENVYKTNDFGLGKGQNRFYENVRQKYINITRLQVKEFIRTKSNLQLTKEFQPRVNKPIVSKYPNSLWSIDLMDLSMYSKSNGGYRYIVNVVDVFTRKIWLRGIKEKSAVVVKNVLQDIIRKARVKPNHLSSDRGREFSGVFTEYCKTNNIKQRFGRSYTPQSNAIVERQNREIRRLIRAYFAKNKKQNWINELENIQNNINNSVSEDIKVAPNKLWKAVKAPIENLPENEKQYINKRDTQREVKFRHTELNEGDYVRIKFTSISSQIRALVKSGESKKIIIRYTPIVFRIIRRFIPRNEFGRSRYLLEGKNGVKVYQQGYKKLFYSNDLLKVKNDFESPQEMNYNKAFELNNVERNIGDVYFDNNIVVREIRNIERDETQAIRKSNRERQLNRRFK
jgi:transposase InsO family protein